MTTCTESGKKCLNDFRIMLKGKSLVPLMVGGMGANISTAEMVLAVEKLGGIAHLSDAMLPDVVDTVYGTHYGADKAKVNFVHKSSWDKSQVHFDFGNLREATMRYVGDVMSRATGKGLVFINCMEKLTFNNPIESLKTRLRCIPDFSARRPAVLFP